jgi:large subunit ribosomal protein L3
MAEMRVPGLIGKKLGMTHVFQEDGSAVPVTIVEAGPCKITQVKTKKRDGYDALQIGFGRVKESRVLKPRKGHFEAAGTEPFALLREFRVDDSSGYKVGAGINVGAVKAGIRVDVIGTSIGKGFAGVVKRHNFSGGPKTHGSKSHDVPGSIGSSAYPSRVWPGQKLPGRLGGARVTVRKVYVVGVDPDRNLLLLKGAVPGKRNSIVLLRPSAGFELIASIEEPVVEKAAPEEKQPKAETKAAAGETAQAEVAVADAEGAAEGDAGAEKKDAKKAEDSAEADGAGAA